MKSFCFVGPVGSDPDFDAKRAILEDLARQLGCRPHFPLDSGDAFSLEDALADLRAATVVLADLSYERPSCYFELGLAEALGVPVAPIAAAGTQIHQVANPRTVMFYADLREYRAMVEDALRRHDCIGCRPTTG